MLGMKASELLLPDCLELEVAAGEAILRLNRLVTPGCRLQREAFCFVRCVLLRLRVAVLVHLQGLDRLGQVLQEALRPRYSRSDTIDSSPMTYLDALDVLLGLVDFLLHWIDSLLREQANEVGKLALVQLLVQL